MRDRAFRRKARSKARARVLRSQAWGRWLREELSEAPVPIHEAHLSSEKYRRFRPRRFLGRLVSCHGVVGHDTWVSDAAERRALEAAQCELSEAQIYYTYKFRVSF